MSPLLQGMLLTALNRGKKISAKCRSSSWFTKFSIQIQTRYDNFGSVSGMVQEPVTLH